MDVAHGPDGEIFRALKDDIIAFTDVSSTPILLEGAIGSATSNSEVVGEYLRPSVKIRDSALTTAQFAIVEVWEMRKPF